MAALPMLSLKEAGETKKMTANLLPCRIHHDGSIDPVGAYWMPVDSTDNSKEAYFRGRKLKGKTLPLPEGYRGVVVERTADELKKETKLPEDDQEDNGDDVVAMETIGTMQTTGEFDEMVIWSHESMASAAADPYVRSVEEWLQVSGKIHSFEDETSGKTK
ncbi:hypothetical protein LMH87_000683 [Akanthomyces muscarius]|uniref:Uncharacterized protein n=1 Tax=Akanthomyces muscarius TaxID=2231603 RepID=A0A9W8QFU7_AKAMU|nr:hypothetical protein LMH87_000683 [Akanthomyces muscarius]KAJ4155441.1 hypothetical protein LMH87_000683 [Akanthomyces muscarius]